MGDAMIKAIRFTNYKALRDTVLPLGRLTLLVGANGTGKSTALQAIRLPELDRKRDMSVGAQADAKSVMEIEIQWGPPHEGMKSKRRTGRHVSSARFHQEGRQQAKSPELDKLVKPARVYSLSGSALAESVKLTPGIRLGPDGSGLAGVLDRLRDEHPERFEALNRELGRCIPEFDRILFTTPGEGCRAIQLRRRAGGHAISAPDVSQGTLLALAILTLAYLPDPPPILGLEEPGRGIHPRLLRDIRDAMYRLAYPESCGEARHPVQVIATTHSPYFLDLFKDHPEEIVIASKTEDQNIRFERLVDLPNVEEVLSGASLGEVWYSGILGGVPAEK
jgi:predicted ATPase